MSILNKAPAWSSKRCEYITLWHGCTDIDRQGIEAIGIDLSKSRLDLDFGRGFYATTLERQASHWAVRRYDSKFVPKDDNGPVILGFKVSRHSLAKLASLAFVLGRYENEDYWSLVQHCRQSRPAKRKKNNAAIIHDHHGPVSEGGYSWYDVVSGPVAADWRQRATLQDEDQFSFHTKKAIDLLNDLVSSGDSEKYLWQKVKP
jgi:hypothetical protein